MKIFRRLLASTIALSMVLLSPGTSAWAQVVQIGGGAAAAGNSAAAAGAASRVTGAASLNGAPGLSIPSLNSSLSAAPSALVGAPVLTAAPAAALPAPAALNAASIPAARAAAFAPSAAASLPAAESPAARAAAPAVSGPAASALEGARRELPDFSKMAASDSKDAAASDFLSRVGELFKKSAPALSAVPAAASGASRATLSKSSKKSTPDAEETDGLGNPTKREGPLDGLGNPTRTGSEGGPDDRTSPDEGGNGNSQIFGAVGIAGLAAGVAGAGISTLLTLPLVIISLILHEIGHAKVAARLGDPTATLQGRASFNPMKWAGHIDPMMTLLLPALTYYMGGFIFGGAKPVPVDSTYFKKPVRDMAIVALAGPVVNTLLAVIGALAYTGAVAVGAGPVILGALTGFVGINALLALFNMIPLPPLDGGHVLTYFLPRSLGAKVQNFYARIGVLGMFPIMLIAVVGGGFIVAAAAGLTHLLIGVSFAVTGVQLAGSALPAIAALGMAIGSLKNPGAIARLAAGAPAPAGPSAPSAAAAAERPVDLIVVFSGEKALTKDLHLSSVDPRAPNYVSSYEGVQRGLLSEMAAVGLTPDTLAAYNATPIASYRRINAATIRLDAAKAAEFSAALAAQGAKVFPNKKIVIPQPVIPEDADPSVRNAVSMSENLQITKADSVQAIAEKRWGKPELNPWQRLKAKLGFEQAPQPLIGVIDSGADVSHPLLKRVKDVKNATSGENVDDIGHGSWVTSMVLNYAPWLKNLTHYKTFLNGSATTDDILKALTMSANDGNLVISNSWGDDEGDPEGPDALLVKKLASEGHIMVFAAGNAGPGKNTVGAPAIVTYKDATTGAIRVVAVAATDRNKKVAYFSSRGPGSPKTKGKDYPHRPDLAAVGYNTEGAWPAALGDADRNDPVLGPVKAISGTSMSTPSVAGAIALLLLMFGVTEKGAKLDAVVNAVMSTLEKTGKNGADDEGEGFIDVKAAYELLYKQFHPDGGVPPTAAARFRRLSAELASQERSDAAFRRAASGESAGVREEMLEHYENFIQPKTAALRVELAALLRAYPDAEYASAGLLGRFWMRLTGRGPKASK